MRNLTQTSTVFFSHANDYGALCPTQACRHAEHAGWIYGSRRALFLCRGTMEMTAQKRKGTYSCSREASPLNACLSIDWISFLYK